MAASVTDKPKTSNMFNMANDFNYDIQFTADISKQMQMPDRLAAGDDIRKMASDFNDASLRAFGLDSAAYGMTMPDKILLGETEYNLDHSTKLNDDTEYDHSGYDSDELQALATDSYVDVTPQKQKHDTALFAAGDMVVPATPGSMLRTTSLYGTGMSKSGPVSADVIAGDSDWMTIQRHVAKLTCRVERLEEENGRRRQREMLLYPLILGYCILQVARMLLARS